MDFLIGEWAGVSPPDTTDEATAGIRANVSPILDGCGIMERISAVGQESAWEVFRVRTFATNINRWVEYRLDSRWPVLQRLEADTPPAGMPWVFQSPGDEPEDGDLRVTMTRGTDGTIRWTEERYNVELTTWEATPDVIYGVRLGAVTPGG